jgi:hypothetical protein
VNRKSEEARKSGFIGIAVSKEERQKLEELAQASNRTMSDVVRFLIRQARLTGQQDIALDYQEQE